MAYLGTWIILLLPLIVLVIIIVLLRKEKGWGALFVSSVLIIGIPIWLNQVVLYKYYVVIPLESSRSAKEWMDFLGSYLGVVGTIVAGALAYWQTEVNRKQDKIIEEQRQDIERQNQNIRNMQAQIAAYQIRPSVFFLDGKLKVYGGERMPETNRKEYDKIYYSLTGKEPSESLVPFIFIRIPFQEKGLVPTERICITGMEWEIADRKYNIELADEKYSLMNEEVEILIDPTDRIVEFGIGGNSEQEFMNAVLTHQENFLFKSYKHEKSQLTIKLTFINQIKKTRRYELKYFIHSNEKALDLRLKKPHISIVGENDGDRNVADE